MLYLISMGIFPEILVRLVSLVLTDTSSPLRQAMPTDMAVTVVGQRLSALSLFTASAAENRSQE